MAAPHERHLQSPGTFVFDLANSRHGYRLNKLAMSLTDPVNRETFRADEPGYMGRFALTDAEAALITDRDWLGLIAAGGNIYLMLKIAGAVGQTLLQIGAAMRGEDLEQFLATRPPPRTGLATRDDL